MTTFIGYEGHPRENPIYNDGTFGKTYMLDHIWYNKLSITQWNIHLGEYNPDTGCIIDSDTVQLPLRRMFASDHAAVFAYVTLP
jgi:hypothetical protein